MGGEKRTHTHTHRASHITNTPHTHTTRTPLPHTLSHPLTCLSPPHQQDMDAENEDPLGLLYLEPGSIEPNVAAAAAAAEAATTTTTTSTTAEAGPSSSAAGKAVVPSLARVNTIEMESSAVTQLRELSVLCGEDPADILACVTPKAGNDTGFAASMAHPVGVPLID